MNDQGSDLARWDALTDALAADEELSEEEHRFVEQLDEPWAARERMVYEELTAAGGPVAHESDRDRAEATLAAFREARAPVKSARWVMGLTTAMVAIAAAIVLWVAWPTAELVPEHAVVSSGVLMLDGVELGAGEALPVERWVVARTRACVQVGDAVGCVSPSSRLRAGPERFELADGVLDLSGTGEVVTAFGTVHATDGHVELSLSDQELRVEAVRGEAELRSADGVVDTLALGQVHTRGAPSPAADPEAELPSVEVVEPPAEDAEAMPEPAQPRAVRARPPAATASDLLGAARRHVAAGEIGRALTTYATLRRQHPSSPEAQAANVSVGELELRRRRAKPALRAFSRYLSGGGGALAEEAHWGKIRALHRLERTDDRDLAIESLRRAHPGSVYLSRASSL